MGIAGWTLWGPSGALGEPQRYPRQKHKICSPEGVHKVVCLKFSDATFSMPLGYCMHPIVFANFCFFSFTSGMHQSSSRRNYIPSPLGTPRRMAQKLGNQLSNSPILSRRAWHRVDGSSSSAGATSSNPPSNRKTLTLRQNNCAISNSLIGDWDQKQPHNTDYA